MSEINSNVVIQSLDTTFQVQENKLTFVPTDTKVSIYTSGGVTKPGGLPGELQYNEGGTSIAGVAGTNYNGAILSLGSVYNVNIDGGTSGQFLQTDGSGTLTWATGTGNITGNASSAGSNNSVQLSDGSGNFRAVSGFTYNSDTQTFLTNAQVHGIEFIGNGWYLTNLDGGQVVGAVPLAQDVTGNSQGNINHLGTLDQLFVSGLSRIEEAIEKYELDADPASGIVNFNVQGHAILYKTQPAISNFTLNIRGSGTWPLSGDLMPGDSLTCTFLNTNGATAYYATSITIDDQIVAPKWLNGAPTTGIPNAINAYTFNIICTEAYTYTVLASLIGYK